jgi:hypothetical protein
MSLVKTNLFQIDGKPMLAPDSGVSVSWQDLDGADSGRDQAGNMHRVVMKYDVGTWGFRYTALSDEELAYLQSLFSGKAEFQFTHPDPCDKSAAVTVRAYRAKHSITWQDARRGLFRDYSFNIIEAGGEEAYV